MVAEMLCAPGCRAVATDDGRTMYECVSIDAAVQMMAVPDALGIDWVAARVAITPNRGTPGS